MSVKIEARRNALGGRTLMAAAAAGLVGVAITLAVAASLLLGRIGASDPAAVGGFTIEPRYVDYGLRHPTLSAPALEPGYVDYGQRHRNQP